MKVLKLLNGMHYWGDLLPSQSFLNKMATALTEQIEILIESPKLKKKFVKLVELSFDPYDWLVDTSVYNLSHPNRISLALEDKKSALVICHFYVDWNPVIDKKNQMIVPWKDVSEIQLNFQIIIEKSEIRKLNYLLPQLSFFRE